MLFQYIAGNLIFGMGARLYMHFSCCRIFLSLSGVVVSVFSNVYILLIGKTAFWQY